MKRILLPGTGTATTFNVASDCTIGVLCGGRIVDVALTANVPTRLEFLGSMQAETLVAA